MVRTGDAAPDTGAGITFVNFGRATINDTGQIAFYGTLAGPGVTAQNDDGYWSGTVAEHHKVVRGGDLSTQNLWNVTTNVMSDAKIGFGLSSGDPRALYVGNSGGVQLLAREGDHAIGMPAGVNYDIIPQTPTILDNGQVAFGGTVSGPGIDASNSNAIWLGNPAAPQLAHQSGGPAPGTAAGVTFTGVAVRFNRHAEVAARGTLTGPGVTSSNDVGIWSGPLNGLQLVAREGAPAPGTSAPAVFGVTIGIPTLNRNGAVAFFSQLSNVGDISRDSGMWMGTPGSLQLAAREGDAIPSVSDVTYGDFTSSDVIINENGQLGVRARVRGVGVTTSNDTAVFSGPAGALRMLAREGSAAPGTAAGVNFGDFSTFTDMVMNSANQVVFQGALQGPGVTLSNNLGLWYAEPNGLTTLLLRSGDTFDIDDGPGVTLRTVESFLYEGDTGGDDSVGASFNDIGQLIVKVEFTNDTGGIFVAQIPEPGGAALLVPTAMALRRRRARV